MIETEEHSDWKTFVRRHWHVGVIFGFAAVLVFLGSIYVFLWFVSNAQTGLVPMSLGQWTMGNLVSFILNAIFWELLLVGIPVVVGAVIVWQWWKRLPEEDRRVRFKMKSRRTGGGGGGSLFFFIAFSIKVYWDGNWNVPISAWTLNYVVNSMVLILLLTAAVVGIPVAIFGTWWIRREIRKP